MRHYYLFLAWVVAAGLCSCSAHRARLEAEKEQKILAEKAAQAPPMFEWPQRGPVAKPSVKIDLGEQKARIYDGSDEVAWTYVATGLPRYPTPQGKYRIMEKIADKYSNRWGVVVDANGNVVNSNARNGVSRIPPGGRFVGAPMPNWMRLTGYGIGMHAGPIPNPGAPASHGCIRLPTEMASLMFENLPAGTSVTIME